MSLGSTSTKWQGKQVNMGVKTEGSVHHIVVVVKSYRSKHLCTWMGICPWFGFGARGEETRPFVDRGGCRAQCKGAW